MTEKEIKLILANTKKQNITTKYFDKYETKLQNIG